MNLPPPTHLSENTSLTFDPVHGYIPFVHAGESSDEITEQKILDHPWVQRLREIHQLQTARFVFPSAEHTRFQHALGAMHLASKFVERLYPSLKTCCPDVPSQAYVECTLRMAALLHDVGHGPFGHFFDEHFLSHYGLTHESLGAVIIQQELGALVGGIRRSPQAALSKDERLNADEIAWLIVRPTTQSDDDKPPWLIMLRSLLSGLYTVDNCDFVLRDAYMTGYAARAFDLDRVLYYSFFSEQGLTISDRGVDALLRFLSARADLFRNVYFHRTIRSIDLSLSDLFRASREYVFPKNPLDALEDYLNFTEWTMLVDVRRWNQSSSSSKRKLGEQWRDLLSRKVEWKLLCQRNLLFDERDRESWSIFSDAQLLESKLRGILPPQICDIPLRIDLARHVYRPDSRRSGPSQNSLFDTAKQRVRPLHDHELYQQLPISHRFCRIYGKSSVHAAEVSRVVDQLLGEVSGDDVTNM